MNESKKIALNKLKTARGQIDGIIKMIEDDRYCVDVSTQILSAIGLLKKANIDVLNAHIRSCVTTAILEGEDQGQEKIDEVINIIDRYIKWQSSALSFYISKYLVIWALSYLWLVLGLL